MKDLARILAAYVDLDADLEQERDGASVPAQIEARQILNDQAYFLLCWGQLENEINAACRNAIRRRRLDSDWQTRRDGICTILKIPEYQACRSKAGSGWSSMAKLAAAALSR